MQDMKLLHILGLLLLLILSYITPKTIHVKKRIPNALQLEAARRRARHFCLNGGDRTKFDVGQPISCSLIRQPDQGVKGQGHSVT